MKYPMMFTFEPKLDYPYRFRFDLIDNEIKPVHQIPHLKKMVTSWLIETDIKFIYRSGLVWCLNAEKDAMLFQLRFA